MSVSISSVMMLVTGGRERTLPEYHHLLSKAGFTDVQFTPNPGENNHNAIMAVKK